VTRLLFCVLAVSGLSLIALRTTKLYAQTAPPVLHLSTEQPVADVQAASPGVKITHLAFDDSPTGTLWDVETPLTLAGGESGCSFNLPVPSQHAALVRLSASKPNDIATRLVIDSFGDMSEELALATATRIDRQLEAAGWKFTPNAVRLSSARIRHLLQENSGIITSNLQCGHAQIFISVSLDPRHRKIVSCSFDYNLQPVPPPIP
jgi:hypothetical protein